VDEELTWENCQQLLVKDDPDLAAKLRELKAMPGSYLLLYGGMQTAHTLIRNNLVHQHRLSVCPILGVGKPLSGSAHRLNSFVLRLMNRVP
jgi:dihydrofolate reductase